MIVMSLDALFEVIKEDITAHYDDKTAHTHIHRMSLLTMMIKQHTHTHHSGARLAQTRGEHYSVVVFWVLSTCFLLL